MASILFSPAPYHILSYGTLLGTSFFHTFINGFAMIKILPRPLFAAVQNRLFPVYFSMQTAIPVLLAWTYPGGQSSPSGLAGLFHVSNRWGYLAPLVVMFLGGLANLAVLLPATQRCMAERKAQEERDGKKSYDPPPHSEEMQALNRQFGKLHGISSLLNLSAYIAMVVYGVSLSSRLT